MAECNAGTTASAVPSEVIDLTNDNEGSPEKGASAGIDEETDLFDLTQEDDGDPETSKPSGIPDEIRKARDRRMRAARNKRYNDKKKLVRKLK